jgi:hypothetical protein
MASLSSRLITHLNIQTIYKDQYLATFIANNPNLTKDEIEDVIKKSQNINLHKNAVIISKTIAKQSFTAAKGFMEQIPMLANIAALMEPNNIEINIAPDEYKALLQYADKSTGKLSKHLSNPLLIVPKNILCSLFFSSFGSFNGPSKDDLKSSCEKAVSKIYQELTNNDTLDDSYVEIQPILKRKRHISISSSLSSISETYDPHKKIKIEPTSDTEDESENEQLFTNQHEQLFTNQHEQLFTNQHEQLFTNQNEITFNNQNTPIQNDLYQNNVDTENYQNTPIQNTKNQNNLDTENYQNNNYSFLINNNETHLENQNLSQLEDENLSQFDNNENQQFNITPQHQEELFTDNTQDFTQILNDLDHIFN